MRASLLVVLLAACGGDKNPAADAAISDDASADSTAAADAMTDAPTEYPALGVYVINTDGTGLTLLTDAGTRHITHVRGLAGTDWLTATRYNEDPDQNGLAMELESNVPGGTYYGGAQIIVFQRSAPSVITSVIPSTAGKIGANSSWTADGKLVFLQQDHPGDPNLTRIKRATFSTLPTLSTLDAIPLPPELILPVDPHQAGLSDDSGALVFAALYQHTSGWMRPVWKLPADGASSMAEASLVGCPICPDNGGCCAWSSFTDVLGANDPRFNNAGTEVMWMHQHPDVSFDLGPIHGNPMRPHTRVLANSSSVDLTPAGIADTTSVSFGEWSPDDSKVVYWHMQIEGNALKQRLFQMSPDGTNRVALDVPDELCPHHPSYLSSTQIVFSAFRCFGANCTCAP